MHSMLTYVVKPCTDFPAAQLANDLHRKKIIFNFGFMPSCLVCARVNL